MKIKNVLLTIGLPSFGAEIETDYMCSSHLGDPGGVWHGGNDVTFKLPEWKEGNKFSLSIPSGVFIGVVTYIRSYDLDESATARVAAECFGGSQPCEKGVQLSVTGEWDGKEGGLTGGLCAFGRFNAFLRDALVIESTLLPKGSEVSYSAYKWVKEARFQLGIDDEEAGKLLSHIASRNANGSDKHQVFICSKVSQDDSQVFSLAHPFEELASRSAAWAA